MMQRSPSPEQAHVPVQSLCLGNGGDVTGDAPFAYGLYTINSQMLYWHGCGDGVVWSEGEEECDDGGQVGGDGCDEQCRLESSETADNDTIEHADELSGERYFGTLDANADVDVVHLSVVSEGTSVAVTSVDVGGGCLLGRGTVLELLLPDGEVLSSASEPPSETCAAVSAEDLSPGDYYVRVSHDDGAHFAYALNVAMRACGNGLVEIGELCDDGNRDRGDGCSDTCFLE